MTVGEEYLRDALDAGRLAQAQATKLADSGGVSSLLAEIEKYIGRFVIMSDYERAVVALWTFHTWAFEAADTTPYLDVSSPVKQCGKTRLFEVLELLVRRPQFGANHTEATLFRVIDQKEPTLLLDEIDRTFAKDPKLYAGIMAVLNTGYRHGATIPRNVGEGSNMKVKDFKTFCPKAFAGIGSLPDTLADRSIPIRLERRAPSQVVERFRERRERQRTEGLRERLARLAEASFDVLDQAEPGLPDALSDRQQDVWEPLLAIADLAGADWPGRARAAAISLHSSRSDENNSILLLAGSREIFDGQGSIRSTDFIRGLVALENGPWAIWWGKDLADADGNPEKADAIFKKLGAKLAGELKLFGIEPKRLRDGATTFRGYDREAFEPHWERYLPPVPLGDGTHATHGTPQVATTSTVASVASVASPEQYPGGRDGCPECGGLHGHTVACSRGRSSRLKLGDSPRLSGQQGEQSQPGAVQMISDLRRQGLPDDKIAEVLKAQGVKPPAGIAGWNEYSVGVAMGERGGQA